MQFASGFKFFKSIWLHINYLNVSSPHLISCLHTNLEPDTWLLVLNKYLLNE